MKIHAKENAKRALRAARAMQSEPHYSHPHDPDCLTDLLTDLMHLASANEWDFERHLRMARGNYVEERLEQP